MKILVTGGRGFLGQNLLRHLEGHEVVAPSSKECDLTVPESLSQFSTSFDQIYHLAAWTQAGDFCLKHPGEQWIINQQINTNVLRWWNEQQPNAKLIAIGTSCCYEPGQPHSEDRFLTGKPIESLYTYGMTKRMLLVGLMALQKQFGRKWLMVVPSTLYGQGYHLDGRQMHFIFDLIRKIILAKRGGPEVVLWGDGHQKRELIHADDFCRAMLELNASVDNEVVNIGAGEDYSIREFASIICDVVDYDFNKVQYDESRYVGAKSKFLITDKLEKLLPSFERTPLQVGLREVIEWFAEQDLSGYEEA